MKELAFIVIACATAACATTPERPPTALADPPSRPLYAIPLAPPRAPFADERHALDAALAVYHAAGFTEDVGLMLDETVLIPYAGGGAVNTWRFVGDGPSVRAQVERVSDAVYGGRMHGWERRFANDAEAGEALLAFMTAMLGHEIAHVISAERGVSQFASDPWREETRAIRFEWAVLRELVARHVVPETFLARARAFSAALLAAAPPGLVAALPKDDEARRALFDAGYGFTASGDIAGHETEVANVLALYSVFRLETADAAPESWAALSASLAKPAPDPTPMRTAATTFLEQVHAAFDSVDLTALTGVLTGSQGAGVMALTAIESGPSGDASGAPAIIVEFRATFDSAVTRARRGAAATLLVRAARELDDVVCDVAPDWRTFRCRTRVDGRDRTPADLTLALPRAFLRLGAFFERWGQALDLVVDHGADPERVAPTLPKESP